jgi:hypothetical protein
MSPRSWSGLLVLFLLFLLPVAACDNSEDGPTEPEDTQAPAVTIQAPTTEATYLTGEATVTISGTASDNETVSRVEWSISGGASGTASGTTSWSASIDLSEGENVVTVTAVDGAGNEATAQITITLDSGAPTVTITGPAGDTLTGSATVDVAGTASDEGTVETVTWSTDQGQSGTASGTTSWTIDDLPLGSGENVITVTATDEVGNSGTATLTVTLDDTDPTVAIVSPIGTGALKLNQASPTVSGTASDNIGLDRVEWSTDTGASGTASGTAEWQIVDLALSLGANVLTVTAYDQVGRSATATITLERFVDAGSASINPGTILTNSNQEIQVNFSLGADATVGAGGVRLARVNDRNEVQSEIGTLFDDGDLNNNGDEILGDDVYSGKVVINEATPQTYRLLVVVDLDGGSQGRSSTVLLPVYAPTSQDEENTVTTVQTNAAQELDDYLSGGTSLADAVDQMATYISEQEGVESVSTEGETAVVVEYESGLRGGLILAQTDASGSVTTRGGGVPSPAGAATFHGDLSATPGSAWRIRSAVDTVPRASGPTIPLHRQTTGTHFGDLQRAPGYAPAGNVPEDVILNQNVLIYAPYESVWAPFNEGPDLVTALDGSILDFSVTYLQNQAATVDALMTMAQYGLVVLATHGAQGEWILTGEVATAQAKADKAALRKDGQVGVFTNIEIGSNGSSATVREDVFGVTSKFVSGIPGMFPQSLVVNNSCESTKSTNLSNAFLAKGVETYFGYSQVVTSGFAVDRVVDLVQGLVANELPTVDEVFTPGLVDPPHSAEWQYVGNGDLHFSDDFINGDFEFGTLEGWTKAGDGRVISQLGTQGPNEGSFMGIISTGLGFTTSSGAISQSFKVADDASTLTLSWNFLSEEFLDYIGTQFQDFFRISIVDESGQTTVLFEKTVDAIASDFNCTQQGGPGCTLVPVSPGIVFDQGDVHMTGWQSLTLDISSFQDQTVTIRFEAGDVGDSIYDTAILLDGMEVN